MSTLLIYYKYDIQLVQSDEGRQKCESEAVEQNQRSFGNREACSAGSVYL